MIAIFDNTFRTGTVKRAEKFREAEKPEMFKLWIDLGGEEVTSAAQLGYNHSPGSIEGQQVLCATDLGEMVIAGFTSEVLTVGVPDGEGNPVLVTPERRVPDGGELY